ncbi:MAG TPA: NDP-sugar synthase, partial [Psychromonas hadalis]|nr:NDP-sugar synthase [Psychromonas hadalis]
MYIFILAAGKGKKTWPYSETRNKVLMPISGVPLITWLIKNIPNIAKQNVLIAVDESDFNDFHYTLNQDPVLKPLLASKAIQIESIKNSTGPANTLQQLTAGVDFDNEPSLVIYGDCYLAQADIKQLIDASSINTLLLRALKTEERSDRIAFNVENDFDVKYHPRNEDYHHEMAAFKVENNFFEQLSFGLPTIFSNLQCGMMPTKEHFLEPVLENWHHTTPVTQITCQQACVNVDYPWDFLNLNQERCSALTANTLGKNSQISEKAILRGFVSLGDNSSIGDNVIINGNVIIGDNTHIT